MILETTKKIIQPRRGVMLSHWDYLLVFIFQTNSKQNTDFRPRSSKFTQQLRSAPFRSFGRTNKNQGLRWVVRSAGKDVNARAPCFFQ